MTDKPAGDLDFEESLAEQNLAGARTGYALAAVLMPAGFTLDWVTYPERAGEFLLIRVVCGVAAALLYALCLWPPAKRHPVWLGAGPPLLCATGIEVMIARLDGPVSPYYAGLNLCILAVAVLYTWRWQQSLLVSTAILLIWIAPWLPEALAGRLPVAPFFNNFYFLTLTAVIAAASAAIRYRSARREYDARTSLSRLTDELAATLTRLQELDRLKNEFFANVSHELRTPLTLILTPVEDLLHREVPDESTPALLVVRRNAHRLLRLIDDLLDLARLDVGGLRLNVAEVEVHDVVGRVVDSARAAAAARGMTLEGPAPSSELMVWADPHRLEIVLTNLVGNAMKFTPDGGRVAVTVTPTEEEIRIQVSDTGPGIAEAELGRIFDRFYQVEGSARRRQGGAGIGLSLAKKLIELHGGNIEVESVVGKGSTFTVVLQRGRDHFREAAIERRRIKTEVHPHRRADDRYDPPPALPTLPEPPELEAPPVYMDRGRRPLVLVAEDEPDLREYIQATLRQHFDVLTAAEGSEALALVKSHAPDLILTDVMMPGTTGTDLCRTLKQDPRLRSTPVIMLTALSSTDNVLEAYASGADDFVTKPFHSRVLLARIHAQLKLRGLGLQLADQARLATAGTLAGGVAHEVKNPLNAVLNAARLLPGAKTRPELERKLTGIIVDGSLRIEKIVSSLEEHARPADGSSVLPCDVQSGLRSSITLLEHKMAGISVHTDWSSTRSVMASVRELNQVFLNLLDNAVRSGARNIWVRVKDEADSVRVTISDDGPGVPADMAPLIFEPFFTTRPVGEGTGLGLYLSRRIVGDCGGSLSYSAREGGGAVFAIELPAVEARA